MKSSIYILIILAFLLGSALSDNFGGGNTPLNQYGAGPQSQYGSGNGLSGYGQEGEDPLAALAESIPGVPGEDYPIYADVPETSFVCEGQVDGGYYADPEAECQAFHICAADSAGGLAKYSFLCPNGTLFNQEYFICDWWFNFDCTQAEELYSRNEEIAAEREAASGGGLDAYGSASTGYGSPSSSPSNGYGSPSVGKAGRRPAPKRRPSSSRNSGSSNQYSAPGSSASSGYGGPSSASSGYGGPSSAAPGGYGAPTPSIPSYQF